jgi:2-oxoglutarate ferredoxin oxidoreductase subunit delta
MRVAPGLAAGERTDALSCSATRASDADAVESVLHADCRRVRVRAMRAQLATRRQAGGWRTMVTDTATSRQSHRLDVELALCKRCGICIALCTRLALRANGDGRPLLDEERCSGCLVCERGCPEFAIRVEAR